MEAAHITASGGYATVAAGVLAELNRDMRQYGAAVFGTVGRERLRERELQETGTRFVLW